MVSLFFAKTYTNINAFIEKEGLSISREWVMWKRSNSELYIELEFVDFVAAFEFMGRVAELAEEHQHHPNWSNVYNKLSISLTTHDAGGIVTQKDHALAEAISLLEGFNSAVA